MKSKKINFSTAADVSKKEFTPRLLFSVCTFMTDKNEYEEMLTSFANAGFDEQNSEFIYIDNRNKNTFDAYSGINHFINVSSGKYLIICHQDILLNFDNANVLIKKIEEITKRDQNWAVLGNAGGNSNLARLYINIVDPYKETRFGDFPCKVKSLDENFLILNRSQNIAPSKNLHGFHFYGTDICIQADLRGLNCYVIDFKLTHKSKGNMNSEFYANKNNLIKKYAAAFRGKFIRTPCSGLFISSNQFLNWLLNKKYVLRKTKRICKIFLK